MLGYSVTLYLSRDVEVVTKQRLEKEVQRGTAAGGHHHRLQNQQGHHHLGASAPSGSLEQVPDGWLEIAAPPCVIVPNQMKQLALFFVQTVVLAEE